ncbi:hypothetical protein GQR58_026207 [Nymphon striatum]|nr:hypothetical protein GQR58_026207 [Nymphon striatum]
MGPKNNFISFYFISRVLFSNILILSFSAIVQSNTTTKAIVQSNTTTKAIVQSNTTTKAIVQSNTTTKAIVQSNTTTKAIVQSNTTTKGLIGERDTDQRPVFSEVFEAYFSHRPIALIFRKEDNDVCLEIKFQNLAYVIELEVRNTTMCVIELEVRKTTMHVLTR